MPISMIVLIMVVHNCPLGRLLEGEGDGFRQKLSDRDVKGRGGQQFCYDAGTKGAW